MVGLVFPAMKSNFNDRVRPLLRQYQHNQTQKQEVHNDEEEQLLKAGSVVDTRYQ